MSVTYEVVCPDGKIRHHPIKLEGDAHKARRHCESYGCQRQPSDPLGWFNPPCPGGKHTVKEVSR